MTVLIDVTLACVCAACVAIVILVRHLAVKSMPTHADPSMVKALDAGPDASTIDGIPLWSDDVLAERERESRPDTVGSDALYVDTFDLEQSERDYRLEADLRATLAVRHGPP